MSYLPFAVCFRNVSKTDEGQYICRATNEGGHADEMLWLLVESTYSYLWNENYIKYGWLIKLVSRLLYFCPWLCHIVVRAVDSRTYVIILLSGF